ncbi:MBL fold metallo-hydrolase [Streptomyces rhizosphaericola]|uniref:MBL fold metallo-hydrolase n=1 Tax=Streptomyces rhizosphaericola TaxID=2564098 RepID=UPI0039EDE85B
MTRTTPPVHEAAAGVFFARGTDVNWILLREGRDLTLIDSGWPGDADALLASVRALGHRPEDVRAVLLTHAHIDHMGGAVHLHQRYRTPVFLHQAELAQTGGGHKQQATAADIAPHLWKPSALAWSLRIVRAGALGPHRVPPALPLPATGALDLPGRPVPVPCHGHTSGHTAYFLPAIGAVATGDALVTAHPLSRTRGPQLLPKLFSHDPAATASSLDALAALDAGLVLPGHGSPWHGPVADAVAAARE